MVTFKKKERNVFGESTVESLQKDLAQYSYSRQHGRTGKQLDDAEAEKRRLYNNLKSREARAKKKAQLKERASRVMSVIKQTDYVEDEYGITAKDRRRYQMCFNAGIQGIPVERDYIKRMTGLDDTQIDVLTKETGLVPSEPVIW